MKFLISKTSDVSGKKSPTSGAKKEEQPHVWSIDIGSLKDLLDLVEKEGEIIIGFTSDYATKRYGHEMPTLEIYDNYRE